MALPKGMEPLPSKPGNAVGVRMSQPWRMAQLALLILFGLTTPLVAYLDFGGTTGGFPSGVVTALWLGVVAGVCWTVYRGYGVQLVIDDGGIRSHMLGADIHVRWSAITGTTLSRPRPDALHVTAPGGITRNGRPSGRTRVGLPIRWLATDPNELQAYIVNRSRSHSPSLSTPPTGIPVVGPESDG